MNTLMFVNGLDKVHAGYVARDQSQYGKYMCVYSIGGTIQQYARHQKCGFNSPAEAIAWFFERFPDGDLLTEENFLHLQAKLLMMTLPKQPTVFNPEYMTERPRPIAAKRTKDGKIVSEFE